MNKSNSIINNPIIRSRVFQVLRWSIMRIISMILRSCNLLYNIILVYFWKESLLLVIDLIALFFYGLLLIYYWGVYIWMHHVCLCCIVHLQTTFIQHLIRHMDTNKPGALADEAGLNDEVTACFCFLMNNFSFYTVLFISLFLFYFQKIFRWLFT